MSAIMGSHTVVADRDGQTPAALARAISDGAPRSFVKFGWLRPPIEG